MSTDEGYREKYLNYLIQELHTNLNGLMANKTAEFNEVFMNTLIGSKGPRELKRNPSRDERFLAKIFRGCSEISNSYFRLNNYAVYIRRYGYRGTYITRSEHLRKKHKMEV